MFVQVRVTITGTIDCILSPSYHVLMKENKICVFDKSLLLLANISLYTVM